MIQEIIDWNQVIYTIAKIEGIAKTEVCRRAGIGGNAAVSMISTFRLVEPKFSEGKNILDQFHKATSGAKPPMAQRKVMLFCGSCQRNYSADKILRVADGKYKCDNCIKRIAIAHQKTYKEKKNNE